jgi:hypothetical protein
MTSTPGISFVLTSCGRFDLLADTMTSFLAHNTAPIAHYLVVEDSGDASVRDTLAGFDVNIEVLANDPPCGQMKSIDRAYALVTTPYIFHCEDDWRFFRSGFIEESLPLLENIPDISAVLCRRAGQNPMHDMIARSVGVSRLADIEFRRPALGAHEFWGGYSFNPGLRRLADYRRFGPFGDCRHEFDASVRFKRAGMGYAVLEHPACETTGRARHIRDPHAADWATLIPGFSPATMFAPVSRNAPAPAVRGSVTRTAMVPQPDEARRRRICMSPSASATTAPMFRRRTMVGRRFRRSRREWGGAQIVSLQAAFRMTVQARSAFPDLDCPERGEAV